MFFSKVPKPSLLLFIHGFNSAGNGEKVTQLRTNLSNLEVVSPTLAYVPDKAMAELEKIISKGLKRKRKIMLVGSSLGGFYAAYLAHKYSLPAIMINPLVEHSRLHSEIGRQKNYYTGKTYEWSMHYCDQLIKYYINPAELSVKPLVLVDEGDEILGHWQAVSCYKNHADVRIYPGGSHRFDHLREAMPAIRKYLDDWC